MKDAQQPNISDLRDASIVTQTFRDMMQKLIRYQEGIDAYEDYPIVICHISDLHLGFLEVARNSRNQSATDMFVKFLEGLPKEEKPHFLVISGDIVSVGDQTQYPRFGRMIQEIEKKGLLKESDCYDIADRIIIVPGNHEIDEKRENVLESFNSHMESLKLNTPLTSRRNGQENEDEIFFGSKRRLSEEESSSKTSCAFYYYLPYRLLFLAMVSCDASDLPGDYWEKIRKMKDELKRKGESEKADALDEITKMHRGSLNEPYCTKVEGTIGEFSEGKIGIFDNMFRTYVFKKSLRFGLIHHHLDSANAKYPCLVNAESLRKILWDKKFRAVLHGHVHYPPNKNEFRVGYVDVLPSGTLGAAITGERNSFNVLKIHRHADNFNGTRIDVFKHTLDPSTLEVTEVTRIYKDINKKKRTKHL